VRGFVDLPFKEIYSSQENAGKEGVVVTASGLQYRAKKTSSNDEAKSPTELETCEFHFKGMTINGEVWDSTHREGEAKKMVPQQALPAVKEALLLMKEGDAWEIVAPAHLAYGRRGKGRLIRPGAAVVIELELIKIWTQRVEKKRHRGL